MLTCLIKIWDNMAYIDSIPPFNSYNVSHCNLVMVVWLNKIDWTWNGVGVGFETPELELELELKSPELELELELKPPELELELELIFWRFAGVGIGVGVETSGVGVGVGVDILEIGRSWSWSWSWNLWSWSWSWSWYYGVDPNPAVYISKYLIMQPQNSKLIHGIKHIEAEIRLPSQTTFSYAFFLNENVSITLNISPKFVPTVWSNNISALV